MLYVTVFNIIFWYKHTLSYLKLTIWVKMQIWGHKFKCTLGSQQFVYKNKSVLYIFRWNADYLAFQIDYSVYNASFTHTNIKKMKARSTPTWVFGESVFLSWKFGHCFNFTYTQIIVKFQKYFIFSFLNI